MTSMDEIAHPSSGSPVGLSKNSGYENEHGQEEGITVAIRMRPLNNIEGDKRRVWKVIPKYSSVAQTTRDGKPLQERVMGRNFFTFDKTFGEDANTARVYSDVAKGIVSSVVNGLNGTIFAYGQTSSGKTYTMQGSGTIESGSSGNDEGGVVHMAAKDIFSQIKEQADDRIFLVRASFLEIYNEEVRDLLSPSNQTLPIREDPKRGVFVQSVEEIVTDFESLLRILFQGEKSRAFAATAMNERSSRSHTIFRITIESRQKGSGNDNDSDDDDDFMYDSDKENSDSRGDGAVRISTLNLVDLAGSESVRHTGATGERKKEGAMINQSLLTLSRVMVALGNSNATHVNYRDSKLTRILQPSLSGNARMAVICCATPSELYLEETRSTLQFASRAKLVKTNAKINEVLDDQSIIRKLQRELAEARRGSTMAPTAHLKELETKAATADSAAKKAKDKLERLKSSILNGGHLFGLHEKKDGIKAPDGDGNVEYKSYGLNLKKRRRSDGFLALEHRSPAKTIDNEVLPSTLPRPVKKQSLHPGVLSASSELTLIREAVLQRSELIAKLKSSLAKHVETIQSQESEITSKLNENEALALARDMEQEKAQRFEETVTLLRAELDGMIASYEKSLAEKDSQVRDALSTIEKELHEKKQLKETIVDLENDMRVVWEEAKTNESRYKEENAHLLSRIQSLTEERDEAAQVAESKILEIGQERDSAVAEVQELQSEVANVRQESAALAREKDEAERSLVKSQAKLETSQTSYEMSVKECNGLRSSVASLHQRCAGLSGDLVALREENSSLAAENQSLGSQLNVSKADSEKKLNCAQEEIATVKSQYIATIEKLENDVSVLSQQNESAKIEMTTLRSQKAISSTLTGQLENEKTELERKLYEATDEARKLKDTLDSETQHILQLQSSITHQQDEMSRKVKDFDETLEYAKRELDDLKEENQTLLSNLNALRDEIAQLEEDKKNVEFALRSSEQDTTSLRTDIEMLTFTASEIEKAKVNLENYVSRLEEDCELLRIDNGTIADELAVSKSKIQSLEAQLTESILDTERVAEENCSLVENLARVTAERDATDCRVRETGEMLIAAMTEGAQYSENLTKTMEENRILQDRTVSLEQELNAAHTLHNELQSEKVALQASIDRLAKAKDEIEDNFVRSSSTFHTERHVLEEKIDQLQRTCFTVESKLEFAAKEIATLQTENDALLKNSKEAAEELRSKLEAAESEKDSIQSDSDASKSLIALLERDLARSREDQDMKKQEIDEVKAAKGSLEAQLRDLEATNFEIQGKLFQESENWRKGKQSLEDQLVNLQNLNAMLKGQVVSAKEKIQRLRSEKEALQQNSEEEVASLRDSLKETESKLQSLQVDHQSSLRQVEDLKTDIQEAQDEATSKSSEIMSLKQQVETLILTNEEMEKNQKAEAQNWNTKFIALGGEKLGLVQAKQALERSLEESKETLARILSDKDSSITTMENLHSNLQSQLDEARMEIVSLSAVRRDLEAKFVDLEATKCCIQGELRKSVEANTTLQDTIESLGARLGSLEASKVEVETMLRDETEKWKIKTEEYNSSRMELENQRDSANARILDSEKSIEEFRIQIEDAQAELVSLKGNLAASNDTVEKLKATNTDITEKLAVVVGEAALLREEKNSLEIELRSKMEAEEKLREDNDRLLADQQMLQACQSKVSELEAHCAEIKKQYADAVDEADLLRRTTESLKEQIHNLEELKTKADSEMEGYEEKLVSERNSFEAQISELNRSNVEILDQLRSAEKKVETLRAEVTSPMPGEQFESELKQLSEENVELKRLLSEANESVQEARDTALAADDELKSRERELEDAVYRLSQLEDELGEYKSNSDLSRNGQSHQELQIELNKARESYQELEAALQQERSDRESCEEELRRQIGEEQRVLINEGEKRMETLRLEAEKLKKSLTQSEKEAYAARQEIEDQRDVVRDANEKTKKFEDQITNLRNALERQEGQVASYMSDLNKIRAENSTLQRSAEENKAKFQKAVSDRDLTNKELATVRQNLQQKESEVLDFVRELEKFRSLSSEQEKLHIENEKARKTIQMKDSQIDTLERQIPRLEREKQFLETEIQNLKTASNDSQPSSYNLRNATDTEKLLKKIEWLQKDNKEKDEKVKSYKQRVMTNTQLKYLKKLKEERNQFLEELQVARKKLEALSNGGTEANISPAELAEVRFEKNALETKLRKVAEHCRRLENEKHGIIEVINSSIKGGSYSAEDVPKAVTDICDKLTSLEEECDSISKGSYMPEGMGSNKTLRRENESLQSTLASNTAKIEKMEKSISQLSKQVSEYEQKLIKVSHERDELQKQVDTAVESGLAEKVRYLENENLQLLSDRRTKTKQLQRAREELEELKMKHSSENPTLAFDTKELMSISSKQTREGDRSIKNALPNEKSTPVSKDSRSYMSSTTLKNILPGSAKKKTRTDDTATDKENVTNTNSPVQSETSKKRRFGFPRSDKKKKRTRETPGLGEAVSTDGDAPSECNQS